jgi:uncharacterized RDD family membrane protein YckC
VTKTNTLQIRTPGGGVFSQELAGPVPRFLAWLIDAAILFGASMALGVALSLLSVIAGGFVQAFAIIAFFLVSVGYSIFLEWFWRGQTVGKRTLRLRVVDAQGLRLKFSQIVIRNLLRVVDAMPALFYLVGGMACVLSRRSQRLGDFAANTIVVHIPNIRAPNLDQIMAGKYNSLRAYPHLEARLRQRVPDGSKPGLAIHHAARPSGTRRAHRAFRGTRRSLPGKGAVPPGSERRHHG